WRAAAGSTVICSADPIFAMSWEQGPPLSIVLDKACAAMMPPCAYPENLSNDTVCAQVLEWELKGPVTSTQHANVLQNHEKSSKWNIKFTVTPHPADLSTVVNWSRADCLGYFSQFAVNETEKGGCHDTTGSHFGNITVGGSASLKGTVFDVSV
ncbi:hypothetical protein BCR34DRAFT_446184, partial [Clohesyomyces aquaticus]